MAEVEQADDENGEISLTIPDTLAEGTYTLNVFSEQYNGDYKTDYASAFETFTLTVDITAPTLSAGSATRDSKTTATVKFTSDEAGTYYYEVVDSGAATPTIGTTEEGTACISGENTISLTTLSGTGAKDIYIIVKDAVGNVSQQLKITIPAIYTLTVNLNGGSGNTTGGQYPAGKVVNIERGQPQQLPLYGLDDLKRRQLCRTLPVQALPLPCPQPIPRLQQIGSTTRPTSLPRSRTAPAPGPATAGRTSGRRSRTLTGATPSPST